MPYFLVIGGLNDSVDNSSNKEVPYKKAERTCVSPYTKNLYILHKPEVVL